MDPTENIRRKMVQEINSDPNPKAELEAQHGKGNVWNTNELSTDFEVLGFMAPFCIVKRKADGKKGSITFQHMPRYYFNFVED